MKDIFEEGEEIIFEEKDSKIKKKSIQKERMAIEFEKLENKPPIMFEDWHME